MAVHNSNYILETKNVIIGYRFKKKNLALTHPINVRIQKGELVGIIGANGVGKSTLLRTLCHLQPALSGEIIIDQKPLSSYTPKYLAQQISVVLTEKPVSTNLTVQELIALGRQPYTNWIGTLNPSDYQQVQEAMEATDTQELKNKKCYELSDGQLQSVLIARAIAQDTPLILLDEPTTHLDIQNRIRVLLLLKNLVSKTQKSILFSTHEIELALQVCDKIILIKKEEVIFDTPDNLIENQYMNGLFSEEFILFDQKQKRFVIP